MDTMMTKQDALDRLKSLNAAVTKAHDDRTLFMDAHMGMFAEFAIGEVVVRADSGERTKVKSHYRFQANQNPMYDTGFNVSCTFENGDNTSRYAGLHPYVTVADYEGRTAHLVNVLQRTRK